MYSGNNDYNYPAVPPLYPMDPCRPIPHHMPQPMPMPHHMPMCPMMDPRFRDCVRVCMMQCGNYSDPIGYPMDISYEPIHNIDMNQLTPYFPEEFE
jgi:hypothetical protein